MTHTPSSADSRRRHTPNSGGTSQHFGGEVAEMLAEAEAAGEATETQVALLQANRAAWTLALLRLLADREQGLASARNLPGPERPQVVADFEEDLGRLNDALDRLLGREPDDEPDDEALGDTAGDITRSSPGASTCGTTGGTVGRATGTAPDGHDDTHEPPGTAQLQVSWEPGQIVVWAGGTRATPLDQDGVRGLLAATGAPSTGWAPHPAIRLPDGTRAPALTIGVGDVLGWLVSAAGPGPDPVGGIRAPSLVWMGNVAAWAVLLASQGSAVPLLRKRRQKRGQTNQKNAAFSVRWTPALVELSLLDSMAESMPGAVGATTPATKPREVIRSALTGMVDAIYRSAASRVEVPAPPPEVQTPRDAAEAVLGRLDGSRFEAPARLGSDLVDRLDRWARPVTEACERLVVQLDPPDSGGAWHLAVLARGLEDHLVSVEVAMVNAGDRRRNLLDQLVRLERLYPPLLRPGSNRRGEVVLSQPEAWELMSERGPQLIAAGYDVRVPALSTRKATPSLRLMTEGGETAVGAHQLADVRWTAVFDDVELTAADISRLAGEARPLIRSGGRWVALDHADLAAAAAALAERADTRRLSGADMLRHALGLEGSPLSGGISLAGGGWAADLLARAAQVSGEPAGEPAGFVGELRTYQGEALAWLGFLDGAGLGGCLALDMGLGKTPTMLAHLLASSGQGPALVIAPPAVVGNWASEAAKFTPSLRIVVHHGAGRADHEDVVIEAAAADVVITTYGTAVRDMDALTKVTWDRLVLDEAQAIKNPANDTSQQLRRLQARVRIALTGTPIENGLGDLWAILDFVNPGLVGARSHFIAQLSGTAPSGQQGNGRSTGDPSGGGGSAGADRGENALRALNGILVFRRTKAEPQIAAELPDRIDELDRCSMTPEQIGLYQAVLDRLINGAASDADQRRKGDVLAAITALKQICNHPAAYVDDDRPLTGRSGKLARLEEIVETVFAAGERVLIFTHFAEWGQKLAGHLTQLTGRTIECYHGGLSRTARDAMIAGFQEGAGAGALVLSLKAGGTGLNLTSASHVVLYDRWWNPAVEDQARDRAWRIGQTKTVICHRLVCPGTVDERVEEVVAGKRRVADLVLPKSSSLSDLDSSQLQLALGIRPDQLLIDDDAEPALVGATGGSR